MKTTNLNQGLPGKICTNALALASLLTWLGLTDYGKSPGEE
jgi:hypothetical protein